MKPKTKFQIRIAGLSLKLPAISDKQIDYAYNKCFQHSGYRTKSGGTTCMECGTVFNRNDNPELLINRLNDQVVCPDCSTDLKIIDTRKRTVQEHKYLCIITTCQEFQVIRFLSVMQYYKKGKKSNYTSCEVVQHWINSKGKFETVSRIRSQNFGYYIDCWCWTSELELRAKSDNQNIESYTLYPIHKYAKDIVRNGFKGNFHGLTPLEMFVKLLSNSKIETLLKSGKKTTFRYFAQGSELRLNMYWNQVKILLRNNYEPNDTGIWTDYIDLLIHFEKDISNAKYVCPIDLNKEHDRLVKKKREIESKKRNEEAKKLAYEQEEQFKALKSRFFGLQFTDGLILIKVLNSVQEYVSEGDKLHHCVFTNRYYSKPESLVMSARINDEPVETIEVSLEDFKVIQSRGMQNNNTDYHDRIIELVNQNMKMIRQRKSQRMKTINQSINQKLQYEL